MAAKNDIYKLVVGDQEYLITDEDAQNRITAIINSYGVNGGIATLDNNGKIPSSQLPSYVDDIIEGYLYEGAFYSDNLHTELITGESGKIYTDLATSTTYRWSGSMYVQIKGDLVIGENQGNAADGKVVHDLIENIKTGPEGNEVLGTTVTSAEHTTIANSIVKTAQVLSTDEKTQVLTNLGISRAKNITISTTPPTSADGQDGDIWFIYSAT